jgi:hypothetical protein
VPDVLLIQPRQARELVWGADVLHVPLGHHLLPVRVDRRPQEEDHVVEDGFDVRIGRAAHEVIEELRRVLRSGDLRGVQAAVDVHECPAVTRQLACVGVGQPLGMRETPRDLAVAIDLAEVVRR